MGEALSAISVESTVSGVAFDSPSTLLVSDETGSEIAAGFADEAGMVEMSDMLIG